MTPTQTPPPPTLGGEERDERLTMIAAGLAQDSFGVSMTEEQAWTHAEDLRSLLTEAASLRESVRVLTERAEKVEADLTDHRQHVGAFLADVYATLVDPCVEGEMTVREACDAILAAAVFQRDGLFQTTARAETAEARVTALTGEVERLRAEVAAWPGALQQLGECIHTAFRKGTDGPGADRVYAAIAACPAATWTEAINWAIWSLDYVAKARAKTALAALTPENPTDIEVPVFLRGIEGAWSEDDLDLDDCK